MGALPAEVARATAHCVRHEDTPLMCTVSALFRDQIEPTVGDLGAYLERAEAEEAGAEEGPGFFLWLSVDVEDIARDDGVLPHFPSAQRGGCVPFGRLTGPLFCALMRLAARASSQRDLAEAPQVIDTRERALEYLRDAAARFPLSPNLPQSLWDFFVPIRWALLRLIPTHMFTSFDLEIQSSYGVWEVACALVWEKRAGPSL
jgi:hypothetical protein